MTDAKNSNMKGNSHDRVIVDEVADLVAERFSQTAGERARRIAALHGLANFYAAHPDLPIPSSVYAATTLEGDWQARIDRIRALSIAYGGRLTHGAGQETGAFVAIDVTPVGTSMHMQVSVHSGPTPGHKVDF